jgi:hypothetical protein
MAFNTKKRIFDVHIIESNRSGKTAEGEALIDVLKISGICGHHYSVADVGDLAEAFEKIRKHPRCLPYHRHFLPFLHFAMHATKDGIYLSGTALLRWRSLLELLAPLRERLEGNLLICMSACSGFYGYQLACSDERFTYHFLVGTRRALDWRDSVLAFHIFYHSLFVRRTRLPDAVTAMNVPLLSRRYSFDYTIGPEVQKKYRKYRTSDEDLVAIRGRAAD